jgi:hypothetical protein
MGCKLATCVFSILNEGKKSVTASGTYLIGLKKVNNECYDELQPWLSPILNLVTEFKNFESNSMRYSLEYYFGSDYKMLGEALGLLNATSNHPCVWCLVSKQDLHMVIPDEEQQKRTLKDHSEKLEKNIHSSNHGYKNKPMCKNLEYDKYVIDILHLFFRVGDVLFQLLLNELCLLDGFDGSSKFSETKHILISKLLLLLKEKCGITINLENINEESILKILSLLGGKKRRKIFENLNITDLFCV